MNDQSDIGFSGPDSLAEETTTAVRKSKACDGNAKRIKASRLNSLIFMVVERAKDTHPRCAVQWRKSVRAGNSLS